MPLIAIPLALPADVVAVHAGDLDADGRDELVLVSQSHAAQSVDPVALTVIDLDGAGREERRTTLALGTTPLLWDVHGGLYGVGPDGPVAIEATGLRTLLPAPTLLGALGPTTPRSADVVDDLDDDGIPEVIFHSRGRLRVVSVDGIDRGSVPVSMKGSLGSREESGGRSQHLTARWPSLVVADQDGDGRKDLLLPEGRRLRVHRTEAGVGATRADLRLPVDLAPRDGPSRREGSRRELGRAWFEDVDSDGKVDLVVQHWLVDGSWFGTRAEIALHRGTGQGFLPAAAVETGSAPVDVRTLDYDGDGDLDLLVPQIDTGVGNLARALLARRLQVQAHLHRMEAGRWNPEPVELRTLTVPVDKPESLAVSLDGDVDGDGHLDAVLAEPGEPVRVYRGSAHGIAEEPLAERDVALPAGEEPLFVRDLTGDGRAEILVWGPGIREAMLLRLD
ncbi:MAG: VCBS repeat-containing protein [Myxococcota bacterium]|nr:VCBS repeat-containing protein [Myxococcota bacterium]